MMGFVCLDHRGEPDAREDKLSTIAEMSARGAMLLNCEPEKRDFDDARSDSSEDRKRQMIESERL